MRLNLHANATVTPKMRAYVQASPASVAELGVGDRTVRRWRCRTTTTVDRTSRPKRFNRRTNEAVGREKKRIAYRLFASHDDRNAFLHQFVHDYNHTRLKCLSYQAPLQVLDNLAGPNTKAGMTLRALQRRTLHAIT